MRTVIRTRTRLLSHLADDEHVLPPDDSLLHLRLQSLADFHLISVAVGGVDVAVSGCDGGLHGALDGHLWTGLWRGNGSVQNTYDCLQRTGHSSAQ